MKKKKDILSEDLSNKEMSDEVMWELLLSLEETNYWLAVRRYIYYRVKVVEGGLISTDPFKEPTTMARNQGIRIGLLDLESQILVEKEERKKKMVEEERKKQESKE